METALEKRMRLLTAGVAGSTLLSAALLLTAFAQRGSQQVVDEITVNRIRFVDSAGVERARIGVQFERGSAPGLLFFDTTGRARVRIGAAIGKGTFAGAPAGCPTAPCRARRRWCIAGDAVGSGWPPATAARVDSLGRASIAFLDTAGHTVRILTP